MTKPTRQAPFSWRNFRVSLEPHFRSTFVLLMFPASVIARQNFHFLLFIGSTRRIVLLASPFNSLP